MHFAPVATLGRNIDANQTTISLHEVRIEEPIEYATIELESSEVIRPRENINGHLKVKMKTYNSKTDIDDQADTRATPCMRRM